MEIENKDINTKKFAKERVLRFKPIVFIRNNIIVFSILFLFSLTLLFGIWNIKKVDIYPVNCEVTSEIEEDINKHFKTNIEGKNFFLITNDYIEEGLFKNIPYIKSVKVEKELPNKISVFVGIYKDTVVGELSENKCYLLSSEGFMMRELCLESETESCCSTYATENDYIYFESLKSVLSLDSNGKERLLVLGNVEDIIKVIESYNFVVEDIELEKDILNINDTDGKVFIFDLNDDIDLQLKRFIVVMGKIQSEEVVFKNLDLRFERPVVKN